VIKTEREIAQNLTLAVEELTLKLAGREAELKRITGSSGVVGKEPEQNLTLAVQELTLKLAEREAELKRITDSLGWRLLSRYGKVKYRFLLPAYKGISRIFGSARRERSS
ncbi:MAG TPA: hypothetical protein VEW46_11130, partial [Pyrinomonadaceae bacterium]|nr:hypothetical protein [Pyrinomonadaceae bacterium]